jgi:hypothetical protein
VINDVGNIIINKVVSTMNRLSGLNG